ncbi:uncharacterized protein SCHCODRAFT_02502992 [Schizophyllum commune H4-8]|uniref:Expressed protein n=1 Tax=Schizophyllum commune (strain H4-8 / FGSC 9210) TaxID=578458 RepID=D8Q5I8_SCHCM|nr:uncharacterized protein SCHCODRAFT_02502992 [Schizophyllum commune H4-8]KAI5892165.1 hypothetical protein SCHCODRAFT_02502992 [Schizophyllum commune H4-8]
MGEEGGSGEVDERVGRWRRVWGGGGGRWAGAEDWARTACPSLASRTLERIPITTTSAVVRDRQFSQQRPAVIAVQSCGRCGAMPLLFRPLRSCPAVVRVGRVRCAFIGRAP